MFNSFLLLLALALLLGADQLEAQQTTAEQTKIYAHYGNCLTGDFGPGKCIYRKDCNFYDTNLLDAASKQHCYSRQRPDLICCPSEPNVLPAFSARIGNRTRSALVIDELPRHPHCGTSFGSRVWGGSITELFEYPWTTLLEYSIFGGSKTHDCGAAFIAQRWLLTAAHCVHRTFLGGRKLTGARLGEWNTTSDPDCVTYQNGQRECAPRHIQASIDLEVIHPQFDTANLTNDIALLRLSEPIDWRQHRYLEPVCLPPARGKIANQLVGSSVDVSGWGVTELKRPSDVKRKAMLFVQPLDRCKELFKPHNYVLNDGQLCASGGINVDSCLGDSGGPLTVEAYSPQRDRYVYLAGIVSYGKEHCGSTDFPGVYTRVSSYMDWIEESIAAFTV